MASVVGNPVSDPTPLPSGLPDLPPPPPGADPREPENQNLSRFSRTPQRARSPFSSRASSPTRTDSTSPPPPPLLAPKPRTASASGAGIRQSVHHHHPIASHGAHLSSRPSSPSSIHSSGSAIFERDIELPAVASLTLNTSNPTLNHKSSRIFQPHGSNLEQTVPAVLDDAVEALTAPQAIDGLEIEAPSSSSTTAMARSPSAQLSPALRARVTSVPAGASRSPSPETPGSPVTSPLTLATTAAAMVHAANDKAATSPISPVHPVGVETLLGSTNSSPTATKQRPPPLRQISNGPQLPGGWAFGDEDVVTPRPDDLDTPSAPTPLPSHLSPSKSQDKRRISFISYNDLLLSVPTTVTNLGEITSGNLSPDHLPGTVSPSVPSRSPAVSQSPVSLSTLAPPSVPSSSVPEAEWSREGLGRGLEQRLEDLVAQDNKA